MKWYEIVGIVGIIGVLGLAVLLGMIGDESTIPTSVISEKDCNYDPLMCKKLFDLENAPCDQFTVMVEWKESSPYTRAYDEKYGKCQSIADSNSIPKITGKYAEAICEIANIPCPENVEFIGHNSIHGNYVGYNFISKKQMIHFKILNEELQFREKILVDGNWESGDWIIWSFPGEEPFPVKKQFSRTFKFYSDKLGNYGNWCYVHNGIYNISDDTTFRASNISCTYTTEKDFTLAKEGLKKLQKKTLSPELSQKLCAAYGKECASGITITVDYNMETGYLLKEKKIDGLMTEFRIIENDVIQYRLAHSSSLSWNTFEDEN